MLKKIKTIVVDKLFLNPKVCFAAFILYIAVVGPALISAADTPTVLAGLTLGVGMILWVIHLVKNHNNKNNKDK